MGHGGARELEDDSGPAKVLDPAVAARLTAALSKFDASNPAFKSSRDDERYMQIVKAWGRAVSTIQGHLRTAIKVFLLSHQLSLDVGCDGGGQGAKPWVEELGVAKWERLYFKLETDGSVSAVVGAHKLGTAQVLTIDYDWLEKMIVEWILFCANKS